LQHESRRSHQSYIDATQLDSMYDILVILIVYNKGVLPEIGVPAKLATGITAGGGVDYQTLYIEIAIYRLYLHQA